MLRNSLSAAGPQINRLFLEGTISGLPDGQLLERFLDARDEAAFAALVERHGPMVLNTCRAVVRDHQAAEDAFQATFLVLVCKARTIHGRGTLSGWLHRVAHRVALQASADAARLRNREQLVGNLIVQDQTRDDSVNDWREVLHEEVARLSDKYRLPVLLCDLEGKTHAQAASELKWGEATVRRRLAGAHNLLRSRLARRGVGLSTAGLAAILGQAAKAGVSTTGIQATVKAATQMSSNAARIAIGEVLSTTAVVLARKTLQTMLLRNVMTFATLVLTFSLLGYVAWGVALPGQKPGQNEAGGEVRKSGNSSIAPLAQAKVDKAIDSNARRSFRGHVVDPEGRPFAGAQLSFVSYTLNRWEETPARVTSGADGRFHFVVSRSEFNSQYDEARWPVGTIMARAAGYAFGLAVANGDGKESTLQLARDLPVEGRIIDLEGRPVVGATVAVLDVRASANASLDAWLKAIEEPKQHGNFEYELLSLRLDYQPKPPLIAPVTTDSNGKFRIEGIGRERIASLRLEGSTIETAHVKVRTRAGATIVVPVHSGGLTNPTLVYGSSFQHVAGPTAPDRGVRARPGYWETAARHDGARRVVQGQPVRR